MTRPVAPPVLSPPGTVGTYHTNSLMAVMCGRVDGERCEVVTVYTPEDFAKGQAWPYLLKFADGSQALAVAHEFVPDAPPDDGVRD